MYKVSKLYDAKITILNNVQNCFETNKVKKNHALNCEIIIFVPKFK